MKKDGLIEFRWHGRGGQGAKTACLLLADAAFHAGRYVQGFPEYGPERMGAPITATVDVTHGLKDHGAVIVNTSKTPAEIRQKLPGWQGRVCTIDARRISEETLGKNFPNTPMLSAAVKVSGVLEEQQFKSDMEESFQHKFATKPQVVAGNMAALVNAWEEVQAG